MQRYIRLTNLIPELLDMVDNKKISFNPAVELSYLSVDEQEQFVAAMKELETPPSLSQAQRLKRFSQEGKCTQEVIQAVLEEDKKAPLERVVIDDKVLRKYFPKSYTPKQMEDQIIRLLEQWQKKQTAGTMRTVSGKFLGMVFFINSDKEGGQTDDDGYRGEGDDNGSCRGYLPAFAKRPGCGEDSHGR